VTDPRPIVAYLQKRALDKSAFVDAHPYTIAALRNRREYGRDVPKWVDLVEHEAINDEI
jgi:hypothetical protein